MKYFLILAILLLALASVYVKKLQIDNNLNNRYEQLKTQYRTSQ